MPQNDQFDTIINGIAGAPVIEGYLAPEARPHRVLWFAVGLGLFLMDAILFWLLLWFWRHG